MKKLLSLLAIAAIFAGCKKSSDDGGSNSSDSFLPNSVGSNWTYKITTGGTSTSTVKYTVSGIDTSAFSRTYRIFNGNNGSNLYYAKVSSDYYTFRVASDQALELLFLKDNLAVNDTWQTNQSITLTIPGAPFPIPVNVITNYIIKEKGTTKTVSSNTYNSVTKVEATITATSTLAGSFNLGTAEFYFAKNIGLIESKILLNNATIGLNLDEKYELQSYEIK